MGGWGYTPSEFWGMALSDWWLIYEANFGEQQETKRSTMDRLRGYLDGA